MSLELLDDGFQFIFRDIWPDAVELNSFRFAIVRRNTFSNIWTKTIILHDTKYNVIGILHQRNAYDLNLNLHAYGFSFSEWNHPPLNFVYCERRTKATETT